MNLDKFYTCKSDITFKEVFLKKNDSEPLQALLELILEINMDYFDKLWYSKNEEEIKKNMYLIMLNLDKKELEAMPKDKRDKIVDKYITNVTIVNDNPEFQKYMSEEEDKRKIQNSLISEAKNAGISEEKNNVAKNLLSMNMSIEDISKATGLSIEEIKNIKEDINVD